ncbi:MAG: ferrous iron transporter B [Lentisphaeraceae bacterium]|nr:ferrous iron transporter B [Lentisphaeraceae bacterium]
MSQTKKIILVGSQNAGKSTLFNQLTTTFVTTANYSGATVSFKTAAARESLLKNTDITDTPGLVSLSGNTPEQEVTVKRLFDQDFKADLFIAVIDATQLARQLLIVKQLQEAGLPVVVCISMLDILEKSGQKLDIEEIQKGINCPCIAINNHDTKSVFKIVEFIEKFEVKPYDKKLPKKYTQDKIEMTFREIDTLVEKVVSGDKKSKELSSLDKLLLHPIFGFVIFFLIMGSIFVSIFSLAGYPMDWIDELFSYLTDKTAEALGDNWFSSLMSDGVVAAIGSVVIFLPQIIILFFAIGYLEGSGYLSRAAMLIDRPLSALGLSGRSFVPLLSGFACAIPAMMATRTIRNKAERLVTIFAIPLMSCSARLPVYVILVAFITPKDEPWKGGLAMTALYFASIFFGIAAAAIASRFGAFKRSGNSHFQLELPSLKLPLFKVIYRSTYERSIYYLKKAGPTIIIIGMALWFLTNYPKGANDSETASTSYAAQVGRLIEPVVEPMGLDWRGGVAIIASFAAREVFVESMILTYKSEDMTIDTDTDDEDKISSQKLLERMRTVTFEGTDQKIFTASTCVGLMFFFSVALQCFPTVVVAKNETGSTKIAMIQLFTFTGVAYLGAVIIVQIMRAAGFA